jgi:hypothetical protein
MRIVRAIADGGNVFKVYPASARGKDLIGDLTAQLQANSIPFLIGGRGDLALTIGPLSKAHEVILRERWGAYIE